jgi:hypothetical protein
MSVHIKIPHERARNPREGGDIFNERSDVLSEEEQIELSVQYITAHWTIARRRSVGRMFCEVARRLALHDDRARADERMLDRYEEQGDGADETGTSWTPTDGGAK